MRFNDEKRDDVCGDRDHKMRDFDRNSLFDLDLDYNKSIDGDETDRDQELVGFVTSLSVTQIELGEDFSLTKASAGLADVVIPEGVEAPTVAPVLVTSLFSRRLSRAIWALYTLRKFFNRTHTSRWTNPSPCFTSANGKSAFITMVVFVSWFGQGLSCRTWLEFRPLAFHRCRFFGGAGPFDSSRN